MLMHPWAQNSLNLLGMDTVHMASQTAATGAAKAGSNKLVYESGLTVSFLGVHWSQYL